MVAVASLATALAATAIDDSEIESRLLTLALLSDQFRHDGREGSETVADLLTLTAAVLRAEVERPDALQ